MKPIGGYFELELQRGASVYHTTPYQFKSGRAALKVILEQVRPSLVYVPFYTCDALLTSIEEAGIDFSFYELNEKLDPVRLPVLKKNEYFIYINYFDLKRNKVYELSEKWGERLIVDNTQAFFMRGNNRSWFFNSCRKFFGVPDGSYLYVPAGESVTKASEQNENYIFDHLLKRFNGHASDGYPFFLENELACDSQKMAMSKLTAVLLSNIDYENAAVVRKENFMYLHGILDKGNKFQIEPLDTGVPMFYPLWLKKSIDKTPLFSRNIFIPTFWKDIFTRGNNQYKLEEELANHLWPLPVDHRYDKDDMGFLIKNLTELI